MKRPITPLVSALCFFVIACGGDAQPDSVQTTNPETVRPQELPDGDPALAQRLVTEEGALLLDVRTPEEYGEDSAEGAVNIPVQALEARISEVVELLQGDRQRPIVVYCRSGRRSTIAKEILLEAGFGQVTNLGPLTAWTGPHATSQP